MAVYPVAMFILVDINFKDSIKRLRIVLPLVCLIGILNPFFDRHVLFRSNGIELTQNLSLFKNLAITGGIISMLTLALKGILTVIASYILIATTTIEKICYAMRLIKIPSVIVTQVMLTYRYVTLLLSEAGRITQAYALRAPNQKGINIKNWGSLLGHLLTKFTMPCFCVASMEIFQTPKAGKTVIKKFKSSKLKSQNLELKTPALYKRSGGF